MVAHRPGCGRHRPRDYLLPRPGSEGLAAGIAVELAGHHRRTDGRAHAARVPLPRLPHHRRLFARRVAPDQRVSHQTSHLVVTLERLSQLSNPEPLIDCDTSHSVIT